MQGKQIVVGVSGGIAAYKTATLVSGLTKRGAKVRVIMTASSTQFITPLTLQTLSRHPVAVNTFEENNPQVVNHIDIADHADLFVIAPATANVIAKMAHGIADDMLTTTLLATQAPIVVAPAMNVHMYDHPAVRENMQKLQERGVYTLEPGVGQLACGYVGKGRMVEPDDIMDWIERFFAQSQTLQGKHMLITAGPTIERLDPVRFLSNFSSGKMGYALAQAAQEAGAEVTLVSGPVSLPVPVGVTCVNVQTATEMGDAVMKYMTSADIIIKAAAVADYRPRVFATKKIKKQEQHINIQLEKTRDIATEIGREKRADQLFIGFAAETDHVAQHAQEKLQRKGMDWIVANDVSVPGAGFGGDTNIVTLYDQQGELISYPQMSKLEIARAMMVLIGEQGK